MMELIAGLLVTMAALAYILEPLTHDVPSTSKRGLDQPPTDAETLIREMRGRLVSVCPACSTPAAPGHAFCAKCGRILVSE